MIDVVAACIYKNNKILLARRKSGILKGKWEFPGGKIEKNESSRDALTREIKEELSIKIEVKNKIGSHPFEVEGKKYCLHLFQCDFKGSTIKLKDHSEVKWILPEEIKDFDLATADISFIDKILNYNLKS